MRSLRTKSSLNIEKIRQHTNQMREKIVNCNYDFISQGIVILEEKKTIYLKMPTFTVRSTIKNWTNLPGNRPKFILSPFTVRMMVREAENTWG